MIIFFKSKDKRDSAIKSHAKINIHLEILNRRRDNYHNLFSLMAELELHDILTLEHSEIYEKSNDVIVEIVNCGGEFSAVMDDIPADKNLISIAVNKYMKSAGAGGHFVFNLTKNIPSGAGLGGGSSNAAAALKLVSGILNREDDQILRNAASAAGSDVPFFLAGGFAFVEGRGEFVYPLDYKDEYLVLLVNNGIHINTGSAYTSLQRAVDDSFPDCTVKKSRIIEKISDKHKWKDIFKNDFEDSVFSSYPGIERIKEGMYDHGAEFSAMSGSGSTVFGLFHDKSSAKYAKECLENEGNRVYFTKFLSREN